MINKYDVIIVGTGPAGLGVAFHLAENTDKKILLVDKTKYSSGGLRNDCKQNYLYPVGFPTQYWTEEQANKLLPMVERHLNPTYQKHTNIDTYVNRANKLETKLLKIPQAHVGTDKSKDLIRGLLQELKNLNVDVQLGKTVVEIDYDNKKVEVKDTDDKIGFKIDRINFDNLVLAPGRAGFQWLQEAMCNLKINYVDNIVDIGVRLEMHERNYPIVRDYYDPKFLFPNKVRTFCTNSGSAHVVKERYVPYYSVNGHAYSTNKTPNHLVNFAMLNTIELTDPVASGHEFANILGQAAMKLGGGKPIMQRIGDFRIGKRSTKATFNDDLYDFQPTLSGCTPGDVSLAMPAKILRNIWKSMKILDTIIPGVLHPSTIIYYPEIKTYANRPVFMDDNFQVKDGLYMIGDGAGTSRGITGAWCSGIRCAEGIIT